MNKYQTALQSFSIESLIGGDKAPIEPCPQLTVKDTQTEKTAATGEHYEHPSDDDDDDSRDDRTGLVTVSPLQDSEATAVQRHQLSTFFNIMLDTATAQRHPASELSAPFNFDYLKVLRMQSAATSAAAEAVDAIRKTFSAQSHWPYSNDASIVPPVPPSTTFYRCADDVDSDDVEGHVSPEADRSGSSSRPNDDPRFGEYRHEL